MANVRLKCPSCQSENSWATYIHNPCPGSDTGTQWEEEAYGPTPDGSPHERPCPGCEEQSVPAAYVKCHDCWHQWGGGGD